MKAFPIIAIYFLLIFACSANADETRSYFKFTCEKTLAIGSSIIIALDVLKERCKIVRNPIAVGKSTANNNLSGVMLDLRAMTQRKYAFYWNGVLIDEKFGGSPEVDSYCLGVLEVQCSQDLQEVKTDIYEGATNVRWDYDGNFYGFNDVYERPSSDTNIYSQSFEFNLFYRREMKYEGEWANKPSDRIYLAIGGHYYSEIDGSKSGIVLSKESINANGSDEVQISPFLRDSYNKEVWCQYCGLTVTSTKGSILEDGQYLGPGPGPFTVTLRSDNEPGTAVVSASWNGGTFDVTRSIEFVDSTSPTLASAIPIDNAAEVNVSDDLVLTFSEDIAAGTGSIVITDGDADTRTIPIGDAQVTIATNTVTINPASNLSYSTGYSIQLASGVINDTAGNAYAGIADSTTLNFTTAAAPDTTAPALVSAAPSDNATEVNISDDLVLEFSENIVAGTGDVSLFKADGTMVQAFDIAALPSGSSIADTMLTLDPSADLQSSISYYVLIDATAIDDAAGNSFAGIADATTLNFTSADVAAPTVTSVRVPSAGSYIAGNTLGFTVNTSENVTVTGTPQIALTIGGATRQAVYASGSGSSTLVFSYTVQSGDNDTDGVAVGAGALSLNSGTLKDSAGNDMTLTLNSVGTMTAVFVDTTAPTAPIITAGDGVSNNTTPTFSGTAEANSTVELFVGSTSVGTATADGSGAWSKTLASGATSAGANSIAAKATDAAGNTSVASSAVTFTLDTGAPLVTSVNVPLAASYTAGSTLSFTVNTSENVTITGTPQIALTIGGTTRQAAYVSGSGSSALVFSYTIQAGETDDDGVAVGALGLNGGTLKDAAGNDMTLTLSGVSDTTAVLVDAVLPTLASSTPSDGATDVSVTGNIALTFSESIVAGTGNVTLFKADGTLVQAFDIAALSSGSSIAGATLTLNPSADLESSTSYYVQVAATAIDDTAGNSFAGITDATTLNFTSADVTAPTVTSVNVPSAGTYIAGSTLSFTVNTSEAVTVVTTGGSPQIALTIGTTVRQATYASGSGSSALVFNYTVQAGETDSDGIAVATLGLNGGTLKDAAGNDMTLTLNSVGATSSLLIDTTAPTLASSTPADGATNVTVTSNIALTFSENIVAGTGNVTLFKADGTSVQAFDIAALPTGSSISGTTLTLNPSADLESSTSYYVQIATTAIDDAAGNSFAGIADATTLNFTSADVTAPTVTSVDVPADDSYSAGATLSFTVNTTENVTVVGSPQLALNIGGSVRQAAYASGSGSSALVFSYVVQAGDNDSDGISLGTLSLNGGTVKNGAGNDLALALAGVATTANVLVDTAAPTVVRVAVPASGSYRASSNLDFITTTSENIFVNTTGGTPQLTITVGSTVRNADYVSGNGSSTLVFRYVVQPGETDSDGIAVGSLGLNGGTLKDNAGNDMTLTLSSVGVTTGVLVDTSVPAAATPTTTDTATTTAEFEISGSAESGATVEVFVGATSVGTTTADGAGAWSFTFAVGDLSIGDNSVSVIVEDSAGNRSAASTAIIITLESAVEPPVFIPLPPEKIISGDLQLVGALTDPEILAGVSVSGGTLCGTIANAGSIANASLCAGASVEGGNLDGTIAGVISAPARISATVESGSTLSHVIIEKSARLELGVVFGEGVALESLSSVPVGMDLSALAEHRSGAVDLESKVTLGEDIEVATLIERIRKLEILQGAVGSIKQDAESGSLLLSLPLLELRLMPIKILKAESSAIPGIYDDEDGNVRIVVEGPLEIFAYPLFTDEAAMKAAIDAYDQSLEMARFSNGNLQIRSRVNGDESNRFSGRPSLSAEDVTGRASEGWVFDVSRFVENREIASFVRTSEEQRLWEQGLVPRPEDWDNFKQTLLADPRIRRVAIGIDGLIEITFDRKPVCAVADYLVEPSLAGPNPNRPLVFIPSGDRNGDGVGDYHAYFPSGGRQLIYLLPSNTAIDRCQN